MNPDELRDAADGAADLLDGTQGRWHSIANVSVPVDLLAVLGPAARQLADLLDAVGDPEELRLLAGGVGVNTPGTRRHWGRIADAAAAARGEGT